MREPLMPTPNIAWGWDYDDNGNVALHIRNSEGSLTTVVLDRECAEAFSRQLYNIFWQLDSKARQARLMRTVEESNAHDRHMYTGRGDL